MSISELHSGRAARILAYVAENDSCPTTEFLDGLQESEKKKIVRLLQRTAEIGVPTNREKFRKERGEIFAFKSYQVRLLCFYLPRAPRPTLVITHGCIKKKDKIDNAELDRAERIRSQILSS